MGTGNERLRIVEGQVIDENDHQLVIDYRKEEAKDLLQSLVRQDGTTAGESSFLLGCTESVTIGAATGSTRLAGVSASGSIRRKAAFVARGHSDDTEADPTAEIVNWDQADDGFTNAPFEQDGSSVYQIALTSNDYPTAVRVLSISGPSYTFARWTNGVGDRFDGDAISEHSGAGNGLRVALDTSLATVIPWTDATESRPCVVWLKDPVTGGADAITTGTLESDGADVYVDVNHYFGQTAGSHSTTGSDYAVFVPGLTIGHKPTTDLSGVTKGGVNDYVLLAEYDSSVPQLSHAVQRSVPSLQGLNDAIAGISNIEQALHAGIRLGSYEDVRDWNAAANITVNTGVDPVTFTFTNPFTGIDGGWVYAGTAAGGELNFAASFVDLVARIAKSEATANYTIIIEATETDGAAFEILSTTAYNALAYDNARRVLPVATFDFTTSTGAVANLTPSNLALYRGIAPGTLMMASSLYNDEKFALDVASMSDEEFLLYGRSELAASGNAEDVAFQFRRQLEVADHNTELILAAVGGLASDLDDTAVFGVSESAAIRLGGDNDYEIGAYYDGSDRFLDANYGGGSAWLWHRRTNGNSQDSTGRVLVEDLHILGGNGKRIWHPLNIANGKGLGNWTFVANGSDVYWENTGGTADRLLIPIAFPFEPAENQMGINFRIAYALSTAGGDSLDVDIIGWDPSGITTYESVSLGSTAMVWTSDLPINDAPMNIAHKDQFYVEIVNTGGGATHWRVGGVEIQIEHHEFTG